jgi:hypothetical protein
MTFRAFQFLQSSCKVQKKKYISENEGDEKRKAPQKIKN